MLKDKSEYIEGAETLEIWRQRAGVTAFHVYAYPANKIVYTSFSRADVNRYVKGLKEKYDVEVTFAEGTPGKSLEYDCGHSPIEYFLSLVLFLVIFSFYFVDDEGFTLFNFILLFFIPHLLRRFIQSYSMKNIV